MPPATQSPAPRAHARRLLAVPAVVALAALVFAAGRWTGSVPPSAEPRVAPVRAAPADAGAVRRAIATPPRPWGAAATAAPGAAAAPASGGDAAALATRSARSRLERLRDEVLSPCLAAPGSPAAPHGARVTFHLTFDARGNEIARGLGADRRAPPGPEVAGCLRRLPPVGSITIPPPGATVGVKVAMTL